MFENSGGGGGGGGGGMEIGDDAETSNGDQDENNFDLGLSPEELASMKSQLMEMKKERQQQRAALRQAWEKRG